VTEGIVLPYEGSSNRIFVQPRGSGFFMFVPVLVLEQPALSLGGNVGYGIAAPDGRKRSTCAQLLKLL
jgi:hypothetical protein